MVDRFGVAFWNDLSCRELVSLGRRADELGFDSIWLAESYHYRSAPPVAAAIGCSTRRIQIALGILPTHSRHPGLVAMEAATLDELTGGRLILGLGAATKAAALHGVEAGPIGVMRDSVAIVRRLLAGERVTYRGKAWSIENAALGLPARRGLPLYLGTFPYSPQMLKVAGALADGVVLVWCNPDWVRRAGECVADGAHQAGRDPASVDLAAYIVMSVDDDPARARAACKPVIASYAPRPVRWREAGLVTAEELEPVLAALARGGVERAAGVVTDALVDKIAIAGTPSDCRDRLKEYVRAGLRLPIAYQVLGPDRVQGMELIAREFLPGRARPAAAPRPGDGLAAAAPPPAAGAGS
jgi:5,10-methylenetetrahydromethanopterin reductase